jgi:hypothetical protein
MSVNIGLPPYLVVLVQQLTPLVVAPLSLVNSLTISPIQPPSSHPDAPLYRVALKVCLVSFPGMSMKELSAQQTDLRLVSEMTV